MTAKLDGTNGLLQQYDYQAPTTGFSYTFAAGVNVLVMNPAGTLATGTITMPAAPADGMTITFSSTQTITALTINGNTGQTVVSKPNALNANQALSYVYRLSNTTWYPFGTQVGQNIGPAFSASSSANTTASSTVWTKLQLNTEQFDTANCFDSTTNYRFTPTVAGYYQVNAQVLTPSNANLSQVGIYKNGSVYAYTTFYHPTTGVTNAFPVSTLVYLNGSTDYIELYGWQQGGTNLPAGAVMTGSLVRAA